MRERADRQAAGPEPHPLPPKGRCNGPSAGLTDIRESRLRNCSWPGGIEIVDAHIFKNRKLAQGFADLCRIVTLLSNGFQMASISREVSGWLRKAGYQNHCFISYAHTDQEMTEFAYRLGVAIQRELSYSIPTAKVYMDKTDIPVGAEWPKDLRVNLCCSIAMVAVIAPIYLTKEHEWCGKEWAAMDKLGKARLPGTPVKPIIPVLFRKTELPPFAAARQSIDLSRIALLGRRYYSTTEFRSAVLRIVAQIAEIAGLIRQHRCAADVKGFKLPRRSAFTHAPVHRQSFPFRKSA